MSGLANQCVMLFAPSLAFVGLIMIGIFVAGFSLGTLYRSHRYNRRDAGDT